MGQEAIRTILAVVTAFVGLAILSVILSKNAKSGALVQDLSSGIAQDLNAATSPLSGTGMTQQVSFASN